LKEDALAGRVPLAAVKDGFIEKWLRAIPMEKDERKQRVRMTAFGKPVAVSRGKPKLSAVPSPYRRRVVVRAYYYKMAGGGYAKLHAHINYVERPGAGEEAVTPRLFSDVSDSVLGHSEVMGWQDDRHHWRFILAPADGGNINMVSYTREFVSEVEKALGTKLQWMAGIHEKPDAMHPRNRHAHIIIRGIADDGSDLVMQRDFIKFELQRIAEELATRHLGQMSQRELDTYMARQEERARMGERAYHSGHRPTRGDGMGHE
jgi:type IV secretory pathway VirD2 relaxase